MFQGERMNEKDQATRMLETFAALGPAQQDWILRAMRRCAERRRSFEDILCELEAERGPLQAQ